LARFACLHAGYYAARAIIVTEGLAIARATDNQHAVALLLHLRGGVAWAQADLPQAMSYYEESLVVRRTLNDRRGIARTLWELGRVVLEQGVVQRAAQLFAEGLALARSVGDQGIIAWLLYDTGRLAFAQHDLADAAARFMESARLNLRLSRSQIWLGEHKCRPARYHGSSSAKGGA
jgi:hypothetical protein